MLDGLDIGHGIDMIRVAQVSHDFCDAQGLTYNSKAGRALLAVDGAREVDLHDRDLETVQAQTRTFVEHRIVPNAGTREKYWRRPDSALISSSGLAVRRSEQDLADCQRAPHGPGPWRITEIAGETASSPNRSVGGGTDRQLADPAP